MEDEMVKIFLGLVLIIILCSDKSEKGLGRYFSCFEGYNVPASNLQRVSDDISQWAKDEKANCFKKYPQD